MNKYEVEKNIEDYQPSQDEIDLLNDTLNLISLIYNCNAQWKDVKQAYAQLPYGGLAKAVFQREDGEYYIHAWTEIKGKEVEVTIGLNILEVDTTQVFRNKKVFEHGKIIKSNIQDNNIYNVIENKNEEEDSYIEVSCPKYASEKDEIIDRIEYYMPTKDEVSFSNRVLHILRKKYECEDIYWESRRNAVVGLSHGLQVCARFSECKEDVMSVSAKIHGISATINIEMGFLNARSNYEENYEEIINFNHPFIYGKLREDDVFLSDFPIEVE